uniref:Importin 7 n=1 Tax=Ovis aries TaxID=9940 RepID=A0AC11ESU0_SHEEP
MDPNTIIEALRGTMDPALREAAERQLNEAHKSLNFVSTLLQITMSEQLDLPVRQNTRMTVMMTMKLKMMMKQRNWAVMKMILTKMDKNIWRFWLSKRVKMEMRKTGKKMMPKKPPWKAILQSLMMKITLLMSIRYLKLYFRLYKIVILCGIRP